MRSTFGLFKANPNEIESLPTGSGAESRPSLSTRHPQVKVEVGVRVRVRVKEEVAETEAINSIDESL